ncbi:MAG: hypothetical protein ACTSRO_10295, partial [Candidatus Heimdallarchaeaceae archaeon]
MKSTNVLKLKNHLEVKIEKLNVDDATCTQLKQLGINKLKEFVLYPSLVLESKLGLSITTIKRLKAKLPLKVPKKPPSTKKKAKKAKASGQKKPSSK